MSKSSKLLRSPGAFVRDSWALDAVRSKTKQWSALARAASRVSTAGVDVQQVTPAAVRELLRQGGLPILTADVLSGGVEDVGTLVWKENVPELIRQAALIADGLYAELRVTSGGVDYSITCDTLGTCVQQLRNVEALQLSFHCDGRTACVLPVEVWVRNALTGSVESRGNNVLAKRMPSALFERCYDEQTQHVSLRELHQGPLDEDRPFDVDFVYSWVDHRDPHWRELIAQYKDPSTIEWDRYTSVDELRYSLRSVAQFAPWVRKIFIVTNCLPPAWFRPHPKIEFVSHEAIFPPDQDCLPTFSSHAIESCLAKIPGLSEHFVYFNDDMFLGVPANKAQFFQGNGCSVAQLEPYGAVIGDVLEGNPDYLNAAINGRELLRSKFNRVPTQLHRHVPYALRKSVLEELERDFPEPFAQVRRARFRKITDISVTSFLYHHYAYQKKEAVRGEAESVLINERRYKFEFAQILDGAQRYQYFCINDGDNSSENERYLRAKQEFLERFLPKPSPWEHPW
jgi:tellurite resistance-related uncharacterized protein